MTISPDYTVTDALAQATLLENKIQKAIRTAIFDVITFEKICSPRLETEIKQAELDIKAGYHSLTTLIENRHELKAAIIRTNAGVSKDTVLINTIKVLGKEYTAAELIERKRSLTLEKSLLNKMKEANINTEKALVEKTKEYADKLEAYIKSQVAATNATKNESLVEKCTNDFGPSNRPFRLDPLDLVKKIASYQEYIDTFESEIDRELSKFNARTLLEI
jgi:hypothetical protein